MFLCVSAHWAIAFTCPTKWPVPLRSNTFTLPGFAFGACLLGWYIPRLTEIIDDSIPYEQVVVDDDMAETLGRLCLSLCEHRLRRGLWMLRGWPTRTVMMLPGGPSQRAAVDLLRSDFEAFATIHARQHEWPALSAVVDRSIFNLVSVKQVVLPLQFRDWEVDDVYLNSIAQSHGVNISTSTCEEAARTRTHRHSTSACNAHIKLFDKA